MNRYICDHCQLQAPPEDNYYPRGWFSVSRRYDPDRPTLASIGETQHFCSPACALTHFTALTERETGDRPTTEVA